MNQTMDNSQNDQKRSTDEQKTNPEKLAVTDEAQRTTTKDSGERSTKTPVGNERDDPKTSGTQAGMGE